MHVVDFSHMIAVFFSLICPRPRWLAFSAAFWFAVMFLVHSLPFWIRLMLDEKFFFESILQRISGWIYFPPRKTPMTLDHCLKLKPDLLRAHTFYQIIPKHSSEASIYSETENQMFPCRCVKPVLSSTYSLKPQTGDDAFHRILSCKWE